MNNLKAIGTESLGELVVEMNILVTPEQIDTIVKKELEFQLMNPMGIDPKDLKALKRVHKWFTMPSEHKALLKAMKASGYYE